MNRFIENNKAQNGYGFTHPDGHLDVPSVPVDPAGESRVMELDSHGNLFQSPSEQTASLDKIQRALQEYTGGNKDLPIWTTGKMQEIGEKVSPPGSRTVIRAMAGSGKTTQIPQALHALGLTQEGDVIIVNNKVDITRSVAQRVSEEMDMPVQTITGPFKSKNDSPLKFVTSGVLMRMLSHNPRLEGISTVIFDEFDERSLEADMTASIVDHALQQGSQVRMVLMSATVDTKKTAEFFGAQVVDVPGRTYPVDTFHSDRALHIEEIPSVAASHAVDYHLQATTDTKGSQLIFMPGKAEIEETARELKRLLAINQITDVDVVPFHGEQDEEIKLRAFALDGKSRIIIATNIAERGITFPNIRHSIDSGYARQIEYDPAADISRLELGRIAQDSATQREGRAGRTASGRCTRLYTESEYMQMQKASKPEIQRVPLRELLLQLKAAGFDREHTPLRIMDMPEKGAWKKAKFQLEKLGALSNKTQANGTNQSILSEIGHRMVELGCDARDARVIIEAEKYGPDVVADMIMMTALGDSKRLIYLPQDPQQRFEVQKNQKSLPTNPQSDLARLMEIYRHAGKQRMSDDTFWKDHGVSRVTFLAVRSRIRELSEQAKRAKIRVGDSTITQYGEAHIRSMLAGYADRVMSPVKTRTGTMYVDSTSRLHGVGRESVCGSGETGQSIIAHGTIQISTRRGPLNLITSASKIPMDMAPQESKHLESRR
ncbi:MAG: helicase-related protein [bacterium]